jgi:hypothetical protein
MRERLFVIGFVVIALGAAIAALTLFPSADVAAGATVTGELSHCGDGFCIDQQRVDFGSASNLAAEPSVVDYDGDGTLGSVLDELLGLVGQTITVEMGPDETVVSLNSLPWPPPANTTTSDSTAPPSSTTLASTTSSTEPSRSTTTTAGPTPTNDPTTQTTSPPATTPTTVPPTGEPVLQGVLERCDPSMCVGGQAVYFGPWWFLTSGTSLADLDGDGVFGTPIDELDSVAGTTVVVELLPDTSQPSAVTVNGQEWRPRAGPPPWAGGPSFGSED